MSRSSKTLTTSSILGAVTQHLGIDQAEGQKKKKKVTLSRKERRKQERQGKKENKSQHAKLRSINNSQIPDPSPAAPVEENKAKRTAETAEAVPPKKKAKVAPPPAPIFEDPEDMEIARLEKLLGIKKDGSRSKAASKLNKEYSQFEGLGDDFGDFLLGLDDIVNDTKPRKKEDSDSDAFGDEDNMGVVPDLLDDDEYPESDISHEDNDAIEDELASDASGDGMSEGEDGEEGQDMSDDGGSMESGGDGESDEGDSEEDSESEDDTAEYYTPASGQDIYGNTKNEEEATGPVAKYVPPALRNKVAAVIDEKSEKYVILRRLMNGMLNRLSDESKDSIIRSLKELFDTNSHQECCHCLNKCIMAACNNSTQVMVTLIPMYAAVVAALHISVNVSVGANLLELLAVNFHKEAHKVKDEPREHALIGNKYANNLLLLMLFLYSLRVVHHTLITEILTDLTALVGELCTHPDGAIACEGLIELLVIIFEHAGPQLNSDDPQAIRSAIITVTDATKDSSIRENTRIRYMLDAAAELKSNKSKRNPSVVMETIGKLRKWLGSVKTALGSKPGDPCLHITLNDFLQADIKGRWWKAGAAWSGRNTENPEKVRQPSNADNYEQKSSASSSGENAQLLSLATKMRMNTPVRRDIFVVMMSSMDPLDAYERLLRLDLRGKQDRELIKVLMECCGQEKTYNKFYADLACILCEQNRQHKSTFQFAFWDAFKTLSEGNFSDRRAINLARLLAGLVAGFHISLSVLKVLDMAELSDRMILFLATLFLALLSSNITEENFLNIFDRVATSADFDSVKDIITFFLQKYFTDMPSGLDVEETKLLLRRRKKVLRTMSEMSVLEVSRGKMEEQEARKRKDSF